MAFDQIKEVKYEMGRYHLLKNSITSLEQQIEEVDTVMKSSATSSVSSVPSFGGSNKYDDKVIKLISKKDTLNSRLQYTKQKVDRIDRVLDMLPEKEKNAVKFYYEYKGRKYIHEICHELSCNRNHLYNTIDSALNKIAIALYGIQSSDQS